MKYIKSFILVFFCFLLLVPACTFIPPLALPDAPSEKVYGNDEYQFSFFYPSSWKLRKSPLPRPLFYLYPSEINVPRETRTIIFMDAWKNRNQTMDLTFDSFTEKQMKEFKEGTILDSGETTMGKERAHKVITKEDGQKRLSIWTVKNRTVYFFHYSAPEERYEEQQKAFNKILDSFEIHASYR